MGADIASEEQFGPYLVYERLGVGGMATVHRALERASDGVERIVALKRLLPHLAEDASFIKAFVREAKLASMLAHVNIVKIYELGRVGTEYFISMEFIEGRDVRRILRHARKVTGPAPIAITVGLVLQLCEALDYAHTQLDEDGHPLGLVHRDISPSNLLVAPTGHLKVIDFGIAKAQSSQLRTQTGRVKGKLAYMAPEAISGSKDLDARSDVWACGVILHELLTARPLFASKNEYQTLMKVQRGDIMPPSTFNQACPPEVDAIVFKALARDPDDRFASAHEMREELEAVRQQYQLHASSRDVALWLDWAFSLETPGGFSSNTVEPPSQVAKSTPRPNKEDDDAVEMVWGSAEGDAEQQTSGPIVLDDVPDVSGKHLAARPQTFVTDEHDSNLDSNLDSIDSVGDIPVHQPSHGSAAHPPRARTSNPPPMATARDSSLSADDLFGMDDLDDAAATIVPRTRPTTVEPVVRFSKSGVMPVARADSPAPVFEFEAGGLEPLRPPPRTRPGVAPAQVRRTAAVSIAPATQKPVAESEQARKPRRWPLVLGLFLLAAGGAAIAVYVTSSSHETANPQPTPPAPTGPAIVKFEVTPADAEIRIDGQTHAGSPWSTELAPGTHQIEIHRSGFTAYLTALELAPADKHSMHIELRPLGTASATTEATLAVSTTPAGLDAELDGVPIAQHTPIKIQVKPGAHVIVVKRGGVELWRQRVNAEAASDYEFAPSFASQASTALAQPPSNEATVKREIAPEVTIEPQAPADKVGSAAPVEMHQVPAPLPEKPVVPAPPPAPLPTGPVTVAPNAVAKLSGDAPNIAKFRGQAIPAVAAAKVCIDTAGAVTSVDFVGKIDKQVATSLADQLKLWKYKPYLQAGAAVTACFVVTMRMK